MDGLLHCTRPPSLSIRHGLNCSASGESNHQHKPPLNRTAVHERWMQTPFCVVFKLEVPTV